MKSTIKTGTRAVTVQPSKLNPGAVVIDIDEGRTVGLGMTASLTLDQVGALIFGLEQAAEAAQIALDRATATA